jgi:hypothetical protein
MPKPPPWPGEAQRPDYYVTLVSQRRPPVRCGSGWVRWVPKSSRGLPGYARTLPPLMRDP